MSIFNITFQSGRSPTRSAQIGLDEISIFEIENGLNRWQATDVCFNILAAVVNL